MSKVYLQGASESLKLYFPSAAPACEFSRLQQVHIFLAFMISVVYLSSGAPGLNACHQNEAKWRAASPPLRLESSASTHNHNSNPRAKCLGWNGGQSLIKKRKSVGVRGYVLKLRHHSYNLTREQFIIA